MRKRPVILARMTGRFSAFNLNNLNTFRRFQLTAGFKKSFVTLLLISQSSAPCAF